MYFLKFIFWHKISTCFRQFLCPSGVFHCTHNNAVYHTGLLTACGQFQYSDTTANEDNSFRNHIRWPKRDFP